MTPKIKILVDGKPFIEITDLEAYDATVGMYKQNDLIAKDAVCSLDADSVAVWTKWKRGKDIHAWLDENGMDSDRQRVVTGNATMVGLIGLCTVINSLGTHGSAKVKSDMSEILPFAQSFLAKLGSGKKTIVDLVGIESIIDDTYSTAVLAAEAVTMVMNKDVPPPTTDPDTIPEGSTDINEEEYLNDLEK